MHTLANKRHCYGAEVASLLLLGYIAIFALSRTRIPGASKLFHERHNGRSFFNVFAKGVSR